MTKANKDALVKWAKTLSNKELENAYYNSVYDSLGSQCEDMYELGYDMRDIEERRKYEKYLAEKSGILEQICIFRGIRLWDCTDARKEQE